MSIDEDEYEGEFYEYNGYLYDDERAMRAAMDEDKARKNSSSHRNFEVDIERLNSDGDLSVYINEDGSTRVE